MHKTGRIIKGIAGFYYVHTSEGILYECKAKGAFRKDSLKPLVGDFVEIAVVDEEKKKGNIERIMPRERELLRPAVANVDQAVVIFAVTNPEPNYRLLDTFLARMELAKVPCLICMNKIDLDTDASLVAQVKERYVNTGYQMLFTSTKKKIGIDTLGEVLLHKCTTVAGPSGVGKSSLINLLQNDVQMETGSISEKTARGKHTTRHSELISLGNNSYILDTPGFTSLSLDEYEKEDIAKGFVEISKWENGCRFAGCSHIHEPDCLVKEKMTAGEISKQRYESYVALYEQCKNKRRY